MISRHLSSCAVLGSTTGRKGTTAVPPPVPRPQSTGMRPGGLENGTASHSMMQWEEKVGLALLEPPEFFLFPQFWDFHNGIFIEL
jgi:hypothetical protein